MSQLSDQTRDRAVALMEALQDPSTDDMQQLLTQGVLEVWGWDEQGGETEEKLLCLHEVANWQTGITVAL